MKKLAFFVNLLIAFSTQAQNIYFPPLSGDSWETIDPATLNYCPDHIDSLYQFLDEEQTNAFLLLKDGRIVLERYFGTYEQDSIGPWFSAGKSLMATLVGIAQEENALDINDPTNLYLGDGWTSMPQNQEDAITIRNHLTMTTGLDDSDFECWDPECLTYLADPGTRWSYHNAPYSILRNVLESATGTGLNAYNFSRINQKTGMSGFWIPFGYNNFYVSKARDMARFGIMIQNGGSWDGTTVLGDQAYLDAMLNTSQNINPSYGYLWWLNGQSSFIPPGIVISIPGSIAPDAPSDIVTAAGSQGQYVSFSPSSGMMVIRQGGSNDNDLAAINLINDIWKRVGELDCTLTSVETISEPSIRVFPNPAMDYIQVDSPFSEELRLRLFSPSGRLLTEVQGSNRLPVSGISSGIYFLEFWDGMKSFNTKVIIQGY